MCWEITLTGWWVVAKLQYWKSGIGIWDLGSGISQTSTFNSFTGYSREAVLCFRYSCLNPEVRLLFVSCLLCSPLVTQPQLESKIIILHSASDLNLLASTDSHDAASRRCLRVFRAFARIKFWYSSQSCNKYEDHIAPNVDPRDSSWLVNGFLDDSSNCIDWNCSLYIIHWQSSTSHAMLQLSLLWK